MCAVEACQKSRTKGVILKNPMGGTFYTVPFIYKNDIFTRIQHCQMYSIFRSFEQFVHYCDDKLDYIPLNFMLGFFVTSVLNRWVNFFNNIGYIDK